MLIGVANGMCSPLNGAGLDSPMHLAWRTDVALLSSMPSIQQCLNIGLTAVYIALGAIDAVVALVAFLQFLRLLSHNHHEGCNRQKVFHCLIGASNLGYLAYFVLTPIAKCCGWRCWSNACGFLVMALPQIVFFATFLLLLSFWLDLSHQSTDRVEDEEEQDYMVLPNAGQHLESGRKCCSCLQFHQIRSRQKFVIGVVLLICLIATTFAGLIWIGVGDNSLNSATLAEIYSDIFAIFMMISGGGLAGYGLVLLHKMRRVRSESTSRDIKKIAGLAVVSVVCFTLRAIIVLFTDIPVLNLWKSQHVSHSQSPVLLFLYYFIGDSIPSSVVLWAMRDLPVRFLEVGNPQLFMMDVAMRPNDLLTQQWMQETTTGVDIKNHFLPPISQLWIKKHGDLLY